MKHKGRQYSLSTGTTNVSLVSSRGVILQEEGGLVTVTLSPRWYDLFAGRGKITFQNKGNPVIDYKVIPVLADSRAMTYLLLWSIPAWLLLAYFFPWNPLLAIFFLLEWLAMAFIALPLLLVTALLASVYMLYISPTISTLFMVLAACALSILLVLSTLYYNRSALNRWMRMTFR